MNPTNFGSRSFHGFQRWKVCEVLKVLKSEAIKKKRPPAVNIFSCKYVAVSEFNALESQLPGSYFSILAVYVCEFIAHEALVAPTVFPEGPRAKLDFGRKGN